MSMRLGVGESARAAEQYSVHMHSSSFSSFSSSNLDTESTASFFQDHSVSLGRLIGLKPGQRRGLYIPNAVRIEENDGGISAIRDACSHVSSRGSVHFSRQRICIPLLMAALVKMRRTRTKSNHNVCF